MPPFDLPSLGTSTSSVRHMRDHGALSFAFGVCHGELGTEGAVSPSPPALGDAAIVVAVRVAAMLANATGQVYSGDDG